MKQKDTILVIDDELGPRMSIEMIFQKTHRVLSATGGEEGLKLLNEHEVDVVILDIRMPNLSGIEILENIKQTHPLIPVIMLTGYGTLATAQKAVRLGAFDYISKPFDIHVLKKVVSSALDKKRLEFRAQKNIEELSSLNNTLTLELENSARLADMGKVSASYIHELKNPMTAINGYVQLLLMQVQAEKKRGHLFGKDFERFLTIVEREISRCCRLSHNFLSFSNSNKLEMVSANLNDLIRESMEVLAPQAKTKHINMLQRIDPALPVQVCNPDLIKQVFLNIALNALDVLVEDDSLTVISRIVPQSRGETGQIKEKLEVIFEDNGPGISEQDLEHIFESYFSTKDKNNGNSGLGLAISKQIVEKHGGKIEATSELGRGTTVKISLPIRQTQVKS